MTSNFRYIKIIDKVTTNHIEQFWMSEKEVLLVEMVDGSNDSDSSKESENETSTDKTVLMPTEPGVSRPVIMETEAYTFTASNLYVPIQKPVFTYKIDGRKIKLTCGIETEYVTQNNMAKALERQYSAVDELFMPRFFNISEVITSQQEQMETSQKTSVAIKENSNSKSTLTNQNTLGNDRTIREDDHQNSFQNPFQNKATMKEQSLKNAIFSHYKTSPVDTSTEQSNSSETDKNLKYPSGPLMEHSTLKYLYPECSNNEKQNEDITLLFSVLEGKWYVEGDVAPFPKELEPYNKPMNSSYTRLKDLNTDSYPTASENCDHNTRRKQNEVISYPDYIPQEPGTTMYFSVKDKK
ncbi:uncharacterized protein LOC119690268 isoform X2 [Teleopsis dalmanni]|nr:uncharacterized protein LOC119688041 isoform X2 [Teleopsis dalmanni]XP_037960975.1 uncharacterized protein LOC119690064 isoform X2 [Teleopsis dalmanni]XP_037961218.1 uncharacterized protein LOC119690268 isoform X2 [Teleopsis dalmanni]